MLNRNLQSLLLPFKINIKNKILRRISIDSRNIMHGDLFLAINGYQQDGRQYIDQAISKGAIAVIAEAQGIAESGFIKLINNNIPIIYLNNLHKKLSFLAGEFYQHPAKNIQLIGVTGTNGKTTITHLIAQWSKIIDNRNTAVMGTIGSGILGKLKISNNTTNSAIDIQNDLYLLVHKKIKLVAIEVSSHALMQYRVAALPFTATIFSNLSREHLDYHHNMNNYKNAKQLLFSQHISNKQIINIDDPTGFEWIKILPNPCAVSIMNNDKLKYLYKNWLYATKIFYHTKNTIIHFKSKWGDGILTSPFIGKFNVTNIMLSMATLLMIDYPLKKIIKTSNLLEPICGRMEFFISSGYPTVIVDYAHTPDALKKVLNTIKLHCNGKIWCIFGCGGDRDSGKRQVMGHIAEKYADNIIITEDNSRYEKSEKIFNNILNGISNKKKAFIISERQKAIKHTIMQANQNDYILIAGKGHENYQLIGEKKILYSDRLEVANTLGILHDNLLIKKNS